jgi:hypothetical protein
MDMEDARPSGRPERNRSNELASDHLLDEVVDLLTVRDASERGVLPADEHAGVQHDSRQEASLTLCETEWHENVNALGCRRVRLQHIAH